MATEEVTARRAVWRRLTEDPGVTALVGNRIYYQVRPDGAPYPCIVLNVISVVPRRDLDGVAWTETRIQVTAMAQTESVAEAVATAVRRALEGLQGSVAGLDVIEARVEAGVVIYQEDTGQTHHHVDVVVMHKGGA